MPTDQSARLIHRLAVLMRHVFEAGRTLDKGKIDSSDWTISLLGDDNFRAPFQLGIVWLIHFLPKYKHHQVGVLLD